MAFVPNIYGPQTPMGEITVTTAGTSIPLDVNWTPKYDAEPVTAAAPQQYSYSAKDIVFNFPSTNAGGIYVVRRGGSKNTPDDILAYFPKQAGVPQLPQSLSSFFQGKFAPYLLSVDADMDGDIVWPVGVS